MKQFIFNIAGKLLKTIGVSIKTEWKLFNTGNFLMFVGRNITNLYIRDDVDFERAKDFCSYCDQSQKADLLKGGLDRQSQELIDLLLQRQQYIYTHNIIDQNIFTDEEKKIQTNINVDRYKKKYSTLKAFPCETFSFHNGLKLLSVDAISNLKGKDVIDAGAFIGDSAIVFSKEYQFKKIYSFEPEERNYKQLCDSVKRYHLAQVEPVKNGLGKGTRRITIASGGLGATVAKEGERGEEIEITTIDIFVKSHRVQVGLIKMDIEGAEFDAISGAQETIRSQKPVLLISIYHTARDFFEIKSLLQGINPEYKFMVRKINPFSLANETILIAY